MANIFAILTTVALLASAFLALKNKNAYQSEIDDRQRAERNLETSEKRLAKLQDDLDQTVAEKKDTRQETVELKAKEEEQIAENERIQRETETQKEVAAEDAEKLAELEEKTREFGEIEELANKIETLKQEVETLETDKVDKEVLRANLLAEKAGSDERIEEYNRVNAKIRKPESYFGSARITGVFPQWGFVTLSAGNSAGVVTGSTLNVVRGGEKIAELRVRSVEPGRSSADIVPSDEGEVSLRAGDRVVPATS